MICPNCGAEMPDGSVFCGKCGQRIIRQTGVNETFFSKVHAEDITLNNMWVVTGDRRFCHGYGATITLGADALSYKVVSKMSTEIWGIAIGALIGLAPAILGMVIGFAISKAKHKNDSPLVIPGSDIVQVSFAERRRKTQDVRILKKDGSVLRIRCTRASLQRWDETEAGTRLQNYARKN